MGDIRPQARGEWGGSLSLDYLLGERWAASVAGRLGSSWFDFNGSAVSGRITDQSWGLRAGVDRLMPVGRRSMLFLGVGVDYGESRSWLDNLVLSQQGPHNYFVGGSTRLGVVGPTGARLQLYGELVHALFRGHARDGISGMKYNWLGQSLTVAAGIRFAVAGGGSRR